MQLDLFSPRLRQGHGGQAHAVIFVRHRRARRYILRVLDDGRLRVTLPRWGSQKEAREFVDRSNEWIARQLRKQPSRPAVSGVHEAELRERASKELPQRLIELAEIHGITVTRVSVRNQRTRWGACSAHGSITLNWRLILTPGFVRDYVIIHELMHRRELNHSKRFWSHVATACPRYDEARQWLLSEGRGVFSGQETC
jgi:predicted metal-dependent hydrolase